MEIKKIRIRRFAALENFEIEPTRLTVIRGDNDSGKTMLLDAILDALFSARVKQKYTRALGRYNKENEEIRIEVDTPQGEFAFPGDASLERLKNFPSIYVPNLLIIREGETAFYDEERLWENIKENLSGMAGGLLKVVQIIREGVGITAKKNEWVSREGRRIKEEVENLRNRLRNLTQVRPKAEELVRLQLERTKSEKKNAFLASIIEELEAAKKSDDYSKAVALKRKYEETLEILDSFLKYTDTDLEVWSKAKEEIAKEITKKESLTTQIEELQKQFSTLQEQLNEKKRQIDDWGRREANILPDMEKSLSHFDATRRKVLRFIPWRPLLLLSILLLGFGSTISLALGAFTVSPFLFGAMASAVTAYLLSKHLETKLQEMGSELSEIFTRAVGEKKTPEEIKLWIEEGRIETERARGETSSISSQIEAWEEKLKDLRPNLEKSEKVLQDSQALIVPIITRTDCPSLEDLEKKVNERRRLEGEKDSLLKQINLVLETNGETEWERRLSVLRPYSGAKGKWDEEEYNNTRIEKASTDREIERLAREIGQVRDPLIELRCRSPEDVWFKAQNTSQKLAQYEIKRKAALLAISIIEGLAEKQDALINTIIEQGPDSASALLADITDGYYRNVSLHQGKIRVRRDTGREFSVEELGTGARAQLYLAIRISLARRIFQDEPGFLLLDDPFTNCDDIRKKELIRTLVKLSDKGWQIIYITIQRDVVSLFEQFAKDYPPGFFTVRHLQERLP